jgi:hypothetical protein
MRFRHALQYTLALILFAGLAACSRLTAANYDKLKSGQSYEEVQGLLGQPANCNEALGLRSCLWGDDKSSITVNFVGGKAVLFSAQNIH